VTNKALHLDETTSKRIADNEATFRHVNEEIEALAERSVAFPATETIGFVCECGHLACHADLYLTHEQYEAIRRNPARFAVLPGHAIEGAEEVVDDLGEAIVVEKIGLSAKKVVLEADPRAV
jgi:hypothetical protein